MKRALVNGIGALRGGYNAGVLTVLYKYLGPEYFNAIYASSVGVFASAFYLSRQIRIIENVWRNLVDGKKLVNIINPLKHKEIMDLRYLEYIFQNEQSKLNLERLFNNPCKLIFVLTEYCSGKTIYCQPDRNNIFRLMSAACSLPLLNSPIIIGGIKYIDGGLNDPLPIKKALEDGYEEIIVVSNKPLGFYVGNRFEFWLKIMNILFPKATQILRNLKIKIEETERLFSNPKVKIIQPRIQLPLKSIFDTNKQRLNVAIDQGIKDAEEFIKMDL